MSYRKRLNQRLRLVKRKNKRRYKVIKSFSNSRKKYVIDKKRKTCSCPDFFYRSRGVENYQCKHLESCYRCLEIPKQPIEKKEKEEKQEKEKEKKPLEEMTLKELKEYARENNMQEKNPTRKKETRFLTSNKRETLLQKIKKYH